MKRVLGVVMMIVGAVLTVPVGIQLVKATLMILSFLGVTTQPTVGLTAFAAGSVIGYAFGTMLMLVGIVLLFYYGIRLARGRKRQ